MPHSSDGTVSNQEYQDNEIELGGVMFPVRGPIRAGRASEFSAGLKVGKATYDEREHAFWIVLDDFSGGFGFREMDVREAGGTHYDNVGGVDTRRPRHITLPPKRTTINPPSDPTGTGLFSVQNSMLVSDVGGTELLHIGVGNKIYSMDNERNGMTLRYNGATDANTAVQFGRIIEHVASDGTRFLLACGRSGTAGAGEYVRSTNGTTWTKAADIPSSGAAELSDMIIWNELLIAHGESDQMFSTVDGISWGVDSAADGAHWRTGDISVKFAGLAMTPWGRPDPFFISKGKLFSLDWYGQIATPIDELGEGNVLTEAIVWNGGIYVTDSWNIYEYTPASGEQIRRIGLVGKDGPPISVSDPDGTYSFEVVQLLPGTSDLYATVRNLVSPRSWRIAAYNGVAWSWLGSEVTSSQPWTAKVNRFPINVSLTVPSRTIDVAALDDQSSNDFTFHSYSLPLTGDIPYRGAGQSFEDGPLSFETGWFSGGFDELEGALIRLAVDGYGITDTETIKVEYRLNNQDRASYITLGTFTNRQQEIWFSLDRRGVGFKTVQFRITLDRGIGVDFFDSAANMNDVGGIDNAVTSMVVDDTVNFRIGDVIRVEAEQMLVTAIDSATETLTITRGYNSTTAAAHADGLDIFKEKGVTPELKSLILLYDKVPKFRTSWNVQVDLSRMFEKAYRIGEEVATLERVWQFLKTIADTPTLANLVIPSVEPAGVNVRITDMPATISDFRRQVGGRGVIDLQMVEPAAD